MFNNQYIIRLGKAVFVVMFVISMETKCETNYQLVVIGSEDGSNKRQCHRSILQC